MAESDVVPVEVVQTFGDGNAVRCNCPGYGWAWHHRNFHESPLTGGGDR